MTNLREEIAEQFNECMGHWEGIDVPDHEQGYRAIDYADKILKLFEQKIDEKRKILDNTNATEFYAKIQVLEDLKQELNEESSKQY